MHLNVEVLGYVYQSLAPCTPSAPSGGSYSNFWLAGTYYRLLDTVQAFNHHTEYA